MAGKKDIRESVKRAYGEVARQAGRASCCGPASCCGEKAVAPESAVPEAELGLSCGDPVAFAEIRPGDVVLDLGSGAGKDVFLAAARTGSTGRVIGVDMTPDMLALAARNAQRFTAATGLANVEFREGTIEELPVDDASADLVISNCVINLSPDKPRVFREVHRVLKPGGRMVVSDIVLERPLPERLRNSEALYAACVAGALVRKDYLAAIRAAGFAKVEVLSDRSYAPSSVNCDPVTKGVAGDLAGAAASITVRALKGRA